MTRSFEIPACPLLVYTDLDGTLLDHHNYRFDAALPAIRKLQRFGVPIVPVTSKTLAELETLLPALGIEGPCIAENGGLIALPPGYLDPGETLPRTGGYLVKYLSLDYAGILAVLNELRQDPRFRFTGFADMDDRRVAELTGLDEAAARRARRRLCSEPLLWEDDEAAFEDFSRQLRERGCSLTTGGRFHHVLGQTDKALAIERLNAWFREAGFTRFTTIALGDSPNDRQMLHSADIAVIIRRSDGDWLQVDTGGPRVLTRAAGPAGWNEFFAEHLDRLVSCDTAERTLHG